MTLVVNLQKQNKKWPHQKVAASVLGLSCTFKNFYAEFVNFYIIHIQQCLCSVAICADPRLHAGLLHFHLL